MKILNKDFLLKYYAKTFKELSEIDLSNNHITTIDAKAFSECTRLSEIYLSKFFKNI